MQKVPLTKYEHIVAGDGMSFWMHITPKIDPAHLKSTLSRLLAENPTLRSHCTDDGYMVVPEDTTPDLSYVSRSDLMKMKFDVPATLQQRMHALSSTPDFKFRDGRQIRFLAHDLSDSTMLDLHFSHQCADGLCVITNCERFMQLLNPSEPLKPKELRSITSDWMNAGNFEKYNNVVKPVALDEFGTVSSLNIPGAKTADYSKACFHHQCPTFSPARVKTLLKRARAHGATIMGVSWAACAVGHMAMLKEYGEKVDFPANILFRTPVNLRGIYPEFNVANKDLTFGSFPIWVPMKVDDNTNIWDMAHYTRDEMMNEIKTHEQERRFFCKHAMGPVIEPEPPYTVNGTSIGAFKFQEEYPSGHSVVDARLMVTYGLTPANALIHFDCFSTNQLGMRFNVAYMYPVISDAAGIAYTEGARHALELMIDNDVVTLGQLKEQLMLK